MKGDEIKSKRSFTAMWKLTNHVLRCFLNHLLRCFFGR